MHSLLTRGSGLYSHLQNRTLGVYWQARARGVLNGLQLTPEVTFLEVGCGAGLWTSYAAPRCGRAYALDLSDDALTAARLWRAPRAPQHPTAEVRFVQASAEQIPFVNETFDRLLAVDLIEHVPDDAAAAREFWRTLRPGGRAVITTLLADRPSYVRRMRFDEHVREYTVASLRHLFEQAGFLVETTFFFYRAPTLLAREIQMATIEAGTGRVLGLDLLVGLPLRLLANLERFLPAGRPGGIGVVLVKPTGRNPSTTLAQRLGDSLTQEGGIP